MVVCEFICISCYIDPEILPRVTLQDIDQEKVFPALTHENSEYASCLSHSCVCVVVHGICSTYYNLPCVED